MKPDWAFFVACGHKAEAVGQMADGGLAFKNTNKQIDDNAW